MTTTQLLLIFSLWFCVFGVFNSTMLSFDDNDNDSNILLENAKRRDLLLSLQDYAEFEEEDYKNPSFYDLLQRMIADTVEKDRKEWNTKNYQDEGMKNHQYQGEFASRDFAPEDQNIENGESKDSIKDPSTFNQQQQRPCRKSKMTDVEVQNLIQTIGQMMKHFQLYTDNIIADGLFGLRSCEVALKNLVSELPISNTYWYGVNKLYETIKKINAQAYHEILKRGNRYDMEYKKILKELPDDFLEFPKRSMATMKNLYEKGMYSFILKC